MNLRNIFAKLIAVAALAATLTIGAATGHAQGRNGQEVRLQVSITGIPGDGVGGPSFRL